MELTFKASLDKWSLGITIGISVLFAVIALSILLSSKGGSLAVAGLFVAIMGACYFYMPLGYVVSTDQLLVKRPGYDVKIALTKISEIKPLTPQELTWSVRTFGNGGLFGFYGKFWNKQIGDMTWYATRRGNFVLIKTPETNYILTPDNPEAFINALSKAVAPKNTPVSA